MSNQTTNEKARQQFMEIINQLEGGILLEEITTQSRAHQHRNHLREMCPIRYRSLLTDGILWEACLVAQAQYEMERQILLKQGMSLQEVQEIALARYIFPLSETEERASQEELVEMEQLEATYRGADLTTILSRVAR